MRELLADAQEGTPFAHHVSAKAAPPEVVRDAPRVRRFAGANDPLDEDQPHDGVSVEVGKCSCDSRLLEGIDPRLVYHEAAREHLGDTADLIFLIRLYRPEVGREVIALRALLEIERRGHALG